MVQSGIKNGPVCDQPRISPAFFIMAKYDQHVYVWLGNLGQYDVITKRLQSLTSK